MQNATIYMFSKHKVMLCLSLDLIVEPRRTVNGKTGHDLKQLS